MPTDVALYIHWPWCKQKCPYCDFNSHAGMIQEESYLKGLLNEFSLWNRPQLVNGLEIDSFTPQKHRISSIFFGGGTPSLMQPLSIERVITEAHQLGTLDKETEVTLECNPTSFDDTRKPIDFFHDIKNSGVNRVSIGIQGLKPEWLGFLGRTHQVEEALATLEAALQVFDNVNVDVIYGLPDQTLPDWTNQLERLTSWQIPHLSAYQLTIEPNTRFFTDVRRGLWEPISSDLEADFFDATRSLLLSAGYDNYEISNFAKPGKACRHNVHIWNYGSYLGLGAGAHGRVVSTDGRVVATQVVRQPEGYLKRWETQASPLSRLEALTPAESVQEAIFSGLRLASGVDTKLLQKRFGMPAYLDAIDMRETRFLAEHRLLELSEERMRLTLQGWPRLNSVLKRILRPLSTPSSPPPATPDDAAIAYNRNVRVSFE